MPNFCETSESSDAAIACFVAFLTLRAESASTFSAEAVPGRRRLFGGLIAAQAAMAAQRRAHRSGAERLHSLHAYFLRPGRPGEPFRFEVEALREGRSFSQRRVRTLQRDRPIFEMLASFCSDDTGPDEDREVRAAAELMAGLPDPETLPDWETIRPGGSPSSSRRTTDAIELRACHPEHDRPGGSPPPWRRVWMRPRSPLPADPSIHAAAIVYASDRSLLRTGARFHLDMTRRQPASLDHALWLHRAPRFDDWLLFACDSPITSGGRVFARGCFLDRRGRRVASVSQEGLVPAHPKRTREG